MRRKTKRTRMETTKTAPSIPMPIALHAGCRAIRPGRLLSCLLLVLFLPPFLGLSSVALGQDNGSGKKNPTMDYALIFGTVWDANDRPVYGVTVKIRRSGDKPNKVRWELMSDHSGEFAQRVPTGQADYIIWADIKTKKGQPKPEARVHIEDNERVDTSIHLPQ